MKDRAEELVALFGERLEEAVDLVSGLVSIESPSDDVARVSEVAAFVVSRISRAGVTAGAVACAGRGDAVSASFGAEAGGTLLVGHHDTVWPVGTLAERPFARVDGVLRGPGVFDMKAGVAVALLVLEAAARGEVRPAAGVGLFLAGDEEVGSEASRGALLAAARERSRVLVLEPCGEGGGAKVARKGTGAIRALFDGIASHAGLEPEKGASALMELCRFVPYADALGDPGLGTSVVPTVAAAGTRRNVVPERAEVVVDFRFWTAAEGERVKRALSAFPLADPRVSFRTEGGVSRPPMEPSPAGLALFDAAARAAGRVGFEMGSRRVGGASDGNLTAAAGIPTLDGLGPRGGGAHARHEHVVLEDLPRRAAMLGLLLEELPS